MPIKYVHFPKDKDSRCTLPPIHMEPDRGVLEDPVPFKATIPLSGSMLIGGRVSHEPIEAIRMTTGATCEETWGCGNLHSALLQRPGKSWRVNSGVLGYLSKFQPCGVDWRLSNWNYATSSTQKGDPLLT